MSCWSLAVEEAVETGRLAAEEVAVLYTQLESSSTLANKP
jgi:hypothetical protein